MTVSVPSFSLRSRWRISTLILVVLQLVLSFSQICGESDVAEASGPHREWPALHESVHVWEDVFSRSDLNRLAIEARKLSSWAMGGDSFTMGKRATCWMNAHKQYGDHEGQTEPELLLERYVQILANLAEQAHTGGGGSGRPWLGYEYWVQRVDSTETPSFHYDKDEAMSSLRRKFVYPDVSSIFYITFVVATTTLRRCVHPQI